MVYSIKKDVILGAPIDGRVALLAESPDDIFAQEGVGAGVTIFPKGNVVVAPADGKVLFVFPSKHAIGLETTDGIEILIHIGIGTYKLKGEGFTLFVKEGDLIERGQKLIEFDKELLKEKIFSDATPMVFTNVNKENISVLKGGEVDINEDIIKITKGKVTE